MDSIKKNSPSNDNNVDTNKRFKCSQCDFQAQYKCVITRHELIHDGPGKYMCSVSGCNYRSHFAHNLGHHARRRHPDTVNSEDMPWYSCSKCDFRTRESVVLKRHKISHEKIKPFACSFPECEFRSYWRSSVHIHELRLHRPDLKTRFTCSFPGCSYQSCDKEGLKSHNLTHSTAKIFACYFPGCGYKGKSDKSVRAHAKIHDPNRARDKECQFCSRKCFDSSSLRLHMRVHLREKPYKCSFTNCGVRSAYTSAVKVHEQTHRDKRNYPCTQDGCIYKGKTAAALTSHNRTHELNAEKSYKCALCPKVFCAEERLMSHARSHTNEKPYKCSDCGYGSSQAGSFKRHRCRTRKDPYCKILKVPSTSTKVANFTTSGVDGESKKTKATKLKFECELCDYQSKHSDKVKEHLFQVHIEQLEPPRATGKWRFMCRECELPLSNIADGKKHVRVVHSTDRPFSCPHCDFKARLIRQLQQHLKEEHKADRVLPTTYCKDCDREIAVRHWSLHVKSHNHAGPYICTPCGYEAPFQSKLFRHIESKLHKRNAIAYQCS